MLYELFLAAAAVGLVTVTIVLVIFKAGSKRVPIWLHGEKGYLDPNNSAQKVAIATGSIFTPATLYLSVVVPAYNEEQRLSLMLDDALAYLTQREKSDKSFTWEIILVDDGSKDKTSQVAFEYSKKVTPDRIRIVQLIQNRGKGGAVRRGALCARGKYVLMADADGATKFADYAKLDDLIRKIERDGHGIVVGSRAHLVKEAVAKRTPLRNLLMYGFHLLCQICVRSIKDTQCGFKLFTRKSSQVLFINQHVERWAFDIELLFNAQRYGIPIGEVPVNWTEIEGSKLQPFQSSLQMAKDLFRIRCCYLFGWWKSSIDNRLEDEYDGSKKTN